MSSTTTLPVTDPIHYMNSYSIHGKDATGKERYYRVRLFEEVTDASGKKTEREISLTIDQWQRQSQLLEHVLKPFFADTTVSTPSEFEVNIDDENIQLSSKADPRLSGYSLFSHIPPEQLTEQVKKMRGIFRNNIEGKRYSTDLLKPPSPLSADHPCPQPIPAKAPIGIRNMTGSDCFISAYLQAFVLDDEELITALWDEAKKNGQTTEFINFFNEYFKAQQDGKENVEGVDELRPSITRENETHTDFLRGPNDSAEAFDFLFSKIARNPIQQGGNQKGYIHVNPDEGDTLEDCIDKSAERERPTGDFSEHMMVLNATGKPFKMVTGSNGCELTSFIQHQSGGGGHYIAFVKRDGNYYKCSDSEVKPIEEKEFLEEAKTARIARYTVT